MASTMLWSTEKPGVKSLFAIQPEKEKGKHVKNAMEHGNKHICFVHNLFQLCKIHIVICMWVMVMIIVFLVEETGVPKVNHRPVARLMYIFYWSTFCFRLRH